MVSKSRKLAPDLKEQVLKGGFFLWFLLPRQGQLWRLVKGDVVKRRELDEDPRPVGAGEKVFTSVR